MSYADVVGQVQQIQAQLALLTAPATTAAASATGATSFADALTSATGGTDATTAASATTDGTTVAAHGVTGDDVVADASRYEGVPYVLGGESTKGMDCSGLVQKTFADLGVSVPRLVHEQQTVGQKVDSLKDAKPGDLIVLNGGDHIAIWAGDGKVIHAPYAGRTVSLQKAWFTDKDVVTIRRVVPSTDDATAAAPAASSGSTSALSAATVSQATALMSMYGATDSADSSDDSSSTSSSSSSASMIAGLLGGTASTAATDPSTSLSSLLSSIGSSTTDGTSTSTAQQLLAARAALLETTS